VPYIRKFLILLLPLACAGADRVVLKNGDTITGTIVKKDGEKLTFHSEFLGDVSMPWPAVQSLTSDETLTVTLPGGDTVAGKVTTSGENLQVATAAGPRSAPLATVDAVRNPAEQKTWERLQHPRLRELWTGFFDLGLGLARGNARTDTLTTSFAASRVTRTDKLAVVFNQIYGTARVDTPVTASDGTTRTERISSTVANAIRGGWSYNRDLTPRLFVSTFNDYEYDQFQNLDLRFVIGGGLGFNAIKTETTTLALIGGGDYNHEKFSTGVNRNSGEINFGDDFLHKFSSASSVTQSFRVFPNLTRTGEYRINFDLAAVTTLRKWLGWHVTVSDRFLSDPLNDPVIGRRQRNDIIFSTGFRVSFPK
jgi:hypothetical protein